MISYRVNTPNFTRVYLLVRHNGYQRHFAVFLRQVKIGMSFSNFRSSIFVLNTDHKSESEFFHSL